MIIAIGFEAHSGKDSVARMLEAFGFDSYSVAYPLKEAACALFGFTQQQVHGSLKDTVDPRWGFTPRKALQDLMMTLREKFGDDFAMQSLRQSLQGMHASAVVPDLRRINEAELIKAWGGFVVRIDRAQKERPAEDALGHVTEHELRAWNGWDYVLDNNGTLADLAIKVGEMIAHLRSVDKAKAKTSL